MPESEHEYLEGVACPHCGESEYTLLHRPALRRVGYNPKSGELYQCGPCLSRVTEAEIETGKTTGQLLDEGYFDDE